MTRHDGSLVVLGQHRRSGYSLDAGHLKLFPFIMSRPSLTEALAVAIIAIILVAGIYVLAFYIK